MKILNIDEIEDNNVRLQHDLFGSSNDFWPLLFAVRMLFCLCEPNSHICDDFILDIDIINIDLPFFYNLSALIATNASNNHKYTTLASSLNGR